MPGSQKLYSGDVNKTRKVKKKDARNVGKMSAAAGKNGRESPQSPGVFRITFY